MKKKLIEVALPLDAINKVSAREKSIRHGHPSTLHLWWARRPLAAARAVIFAQLVDDPAGYVDVLLSDPGKKRAAERELRKHLAEHFDDATALPEPTLEEVIAKQERERLFAILEDLVRWENTTNEEVLERARAEIWQSWRRACAENADHPQARVLFNRNKLPAFHDPFAGGGSLPLEAQRLGLESYASDLNPVAVLINKAMIEIPPRFAGMPPVNPRSREDENLGQTPRVFARKWSGAQGLAEDVRHYGKWMRGEAEKRIGHLYPKVEVTAEMVEERPDLRPYLGRKLTVIAWLWARTVRSPNPAFNDIEVPLVSTFILSSKKGKEAYVEPVIEGGGYRFEVRTGPPPGTAKAGTSAGKRKAFLCLISGVPVGYDYIRSEGQAGRMGARLMAVVVEGNRGRIYLSPTREHEERARSAKPGARPETPLPENPRDFKTPNYGLTTFGDLFTDRQLVALNTFCDLVAEVQECVQRDAVAARQRHGRDATAYADAVALYLSLGVSKLSDAQSSLCRWKTTMDQSIATFGRQALPMVWDYSEANAFGRTAGDPLVSINNMMRVVDKLPANIMGYAYQAEAQRQTSIAPPVVSTDPPYYDNIGYADLSDFFYVWLRRALNPVFPELFATLAVPKAEELVATPYRHGSKEAAEAFFLHGMTEALQRLAEQAHPGFPVTIYYAFKQSERKGDTGVTSTGWETFLDAVIRSGFAITGTWPMRTELGNRMIGMGTNALASSIVLVCRPRPSEATVATRREFVSALKAELPQALVHLQRGNIAPVDLAQAAIGPGMAVYTRYAKVLNAEGNALSVREALALINQTLDEALVEQEGDFDADSRWALAWFEQSGFDEGEYGIAETLSKAKNTSVTGLVEAGILTSKGGKVRLLKPGELPEDWGPTTDPRLTAWEMVHHLVRALEAGGEGAAAELAAQLGTKAEAARELCYRLYTLCERKKRAAEALSYNGLVQSWPEITRLAQAGVRTRQAGLFGTDDTDPKSPSLGSS